MQNLYIDIAEIMEYIIFQIFKNHNSDDGKSKLERVAKRAGKGGNRYMIPAEHGL